MKLTEAESKEVYKLLAAALNAEFECGEWQSGDEPAYEEFCDQAERTKNELLKFLGI